MKVDGQILQTLFSAGPVALFAWKPVEGSPVEFASQSVEGILGYPAEHFAGGGFAFSGLVHPEDISRVAAATREAATRGLDRLTHEPYRVRHADGHWVWISDTTMIVRDAEGRMERLLGYVEDVTERHEQGALLQEERDRLELVLAGTRLGMWDWNPQTNEVAFDRRWCEMLGHELGEVTNSLEEWERRVHPDDLAGCYADITAHMEGKVDFYENVHRMRHRDGHWVYILDRGRIVERDAEGKPTRFTGTHTDITPQKEAELAAQRANEAKSLFLANMSHEIRTPLHGILGLSRLLQETPLDDDQSKLLSLARESGEALLNVIDDILDFSKVEAGKLDLDPQPFELAPTLQRVHALFRERAAEKELDYRLLLSPQLPAWVVGDPHRLRQVLANLVSNAIKFTAEGSVWLDAASEQTSAGLHLLTIRVGDSGRGIADTSAIWDSFDQGDNSISRSFGGTGLGLAISRQLVELMDGFIEVHSCPGEGTVFTVHLPLHEAREPIETPRIAEVGPLPPARALVVDDNFTNRTVLVRSLERLGLRADSVDGGNEAIEACRRGDYDIAFLDLHMPGMSGLEVARELAGLAAAPPLVAVSADAFRETRERCHEAGMAGFLPKPFRAGELRELLLRVLCAEPAR